LRFVCVEPPRLRQFLRSFSHHVGFGVEIDARLLDDQRLRKVPPTWRASGRSSARRYRREQARLETWRDLKRFETLSAASGEGFQITTTGVSRTSCDMP
jgi:hypothetical protein